jgi:hypothetical protein
VSDRIGSGRGESSATDGLGEELRSVGGRVHPDGTVTLYHHTTPENAVQIRRTGRMAGREDGVFFTTNPDTGAHAAGRGGDVVQVRVPLDQLVLDDIFDDEAHVRVPTRRPGDQIEVQVEQQSDAVAEYAWGSSIGTPTFGRLNDGLRRGSPLDPDAAALRDALDEQLARSEPLDRPLTVYRVFSSPDAAQEIQRLVRTRDRTWVDPGFMSTSRDPDVAEDFAVDGPGLIEMEITIPAGTRVVDVDAVLGDDNVYPQSEVILPRGSGIRLDTARPRDGRLVVTGDWVGGSREHSG